MNRETIEKAVREYAEENLFYPEDIYNDSDIREMNDGLAYAYKAGAEWRINSVWHNADEEPEQLDKTILVELDEIGIEGYIYDTLEAGDYKYILQRKKLYSKATRWAYIEDLLPDRKED